MRLNAIEAHRALSFSDKGANLANLGSFNSVIGPNGTGKTNLFRLLTLVQDALGNQNLDLGPFYWRGDRSGPLRVNVNLRFDSKEVAFLSSFMAASAALGRLPSRPQRTEPSSDNRLLLQKSVSESSMELFRQLFDRPVTVSLTGGVVEGRPAAIELVIPLDGVQVKVDSRGHLGVGGLVGLASPTNSLGEYLVERLTRLHEREVRAFISNPRIDNLRPLVSFACPTLRDFVSDLSLARPGGRGTGPILISPLSFKAIDTEFPSGIAGIAPLRAEVLRVGNVPDNLSFLQLLSVLFRLGLVRTADLRTRPIQFGTTSASVSDALQEPLTGTELATLLFQWKTSSNREERIRFAKLQEKFRELVHGFAFDAVNVPPDPTRPNRSSRPNVPATGSSVVIESEGFEVPLDYSSAGVFEVLVTLTAVALANGKVVLLDEPAANLHPQLQTKIRDEIRSVADRGECQVFIITHSPYIVPDDKLQDSWRFDRAKSESTAIHLAEAIRDTSGKDPAVVEARWLAEPEVKSMLFARGSLLVEGPSDKTGMLLVADYFRRSGITPTLDLDETPIVNTAGSSTSRFVRLAKKLDIPFAVAYDNDALMRVNRSAVVNGKKLRLSPALRTLVEEIGLLAEDSAAVESICLDESSYEGTGDDVWFAKALYDKLRAIALKYGVFAFATDLEGLIGAERHKKRGKIVRDLDLLQDQIEEGTLNTAPFLDLFRYVRNRVDLHDGVATEGSSGTDPA